VHLRPRRFLRFQLRTPVGQIPSAHAILRLSRTTAGMVARLLRICPSIVKQVSERATWPVGTTGDQRTPDDV
jgi:hypothetical protein